MWFDLILLVSGFIFLIKGADVLVDGSSSLARKLGISTFVVGMTIVAFGTSMPEMAVSILASWRGSAGIALGNVIGSNISNTLLILGVSAALTSLIVKKATINKEIPFSLLAVFVIGFLGNDYFFNGFLPNILSRTDGFIMILFFIIFIYYVFGISQNKEEGIISSAVEKIKSETPQEFSLLKSSFMVAGGLIGLILGGRLIVEGALGVADIFELSEAFIGLTIVALGTSLPELAASGVAAYKGNADIAIGNVVGSNIFNLFLVAGISSIIRPIPFDTILNADILILIFITMALIFLIYFGKRNVLSRYEGVVLLLMYFVYMIFLIIRG